MINKLRVPALGLMLALATTLSTTTNANAWHRHHHHHWGWVGPAFVGGLAVGALASRPYYYRSCWRERHVYWRHGHRHVRWVRVCG
jgi:hypothetical protein